MVSFTDKEILQFLGLKFAVYNREQVLMARIRYLPNSGGNPDSPARLCIPKKKLRRLNFALIEEFDEPETIDLKLE